MPIAAAIPAIIGAAGSIGGAAIGAAGAHGASNAQSQAAQQGINTIQQNQQNTLGSLGKIYGGANAGLQPYQQAGVTALGNLSNAYNNPTVNNTGAVNATNAGEQWGQQFQAPTANQAAQTPGYQFLQEAGQNSLLNNASALGNLRSGSTAKGLENYATNLASANYQNTYNNALNSYNTNFNAFQQNRANLANGLGGLASGGLSAAGTLGGLASSQAGQLANVNMGSASDIANLLGNKGAATASGYTGAANAWGQGISNLGQLGAQTASAYGLGAGRQATLGAFQNTAAANSDQGLSFT